MNNVQLIQSQQSAVAAFRKFLEERKRESGLMAPTGRVAYILGSKTGILGNLQSGKLYGKSF